MTTNQFNYMQLAQTALRDAQNYAIAKGQLSETVRHQKMTELIDRNKLDESVRHNLVAEQLQHQSNQITDWYNQRMASINTMNALTNKKQAETQATKVAYDYDIGKRNASVNSMNAVTNQFAADAKAHNDRIAAEARQKAAEASWGQYKNQETYGAAHAAADLWNAVTNTWKLL